MDEKELVVVEMVREEFSSSRCKIAPFFDGVEHDVASARFFVWFLHGVILTYHHDHRKNA
jgi:hypothetical protein